MKVARSGDLPLRSAPQDPRLQWTGGPHVRCSRPTVVRDVLAHDTPPVAAILRRTPAASMVMRDGGSHAAGRRGGRGRFGVSEVCPAPLRATPAVGHGSGSLEKT